MTTTRRFAHNLTVMCALLVFSSWAFGQKDHGVRGGIQNTGADCNKREFQSRIHRLPMIGQTISYYLVFEKLGGGMGVVYKAQDIKMDGFVALKFPACAVENNHVIGLRRRNMRWTG